MPPPGKRPLVLHLTGSRLDHGGILQSLRAIAPCNGARNLLGVHRDFQQNRTPLMRLWRLTRVRDSEIINLPTCWHALWTALRLLPRCWRTPHLIVHAHTRYALLVVLWLHAFGIRRTCATLHHYGRFKPLYRFAALCLGKRLLWLSPSMKTWYGTGPPSWKQCLPSTPPLPQPRTKAPPPPPLVLGISGLLVPWKRWERALHALSLLPPELRTQLRLRHVGQTDDSAISRDYAQRLRALSESPALRGLVHWQGWQSDTSDFYASIHLLLVTSEHEPLSLVAQEAIACGIPVIANATGGVKDFVRHGQDGWILPDPSPEALAALLSEILSNPGQLPVPRTSPCLQASHSAKVLRHLYAALLSD